MYIKFTLLYNIVGNSYAAYYVFWGINIISCVLLVVNQCWLQAPQPAAAAAWQASPVGPRAQAALIAPPRPPPHAFLPHEHHAAHLDRWACNAHSHVNDL